MGTKLADRCISGDDSYIAIVRCHIIRMLEKFGALGAGKRHVAVMTIAAIAALSASVGLNAQGSRYPVQVSPVTPAYPPNTHRRLYWIDNDSVLFVAQGAMVGPSKRESHVAIWNIRNDSTKTLGRFEDTYAVFCYADGYIKFATRIEAGDIVFKEGLLTAISETRVSRAYLESDAVRKRGEVPSRFTCNNHQLADLGPRGRCLTPLREGDGYLDLTGGVCTQRFKKGLEEIAKLPNWDASRVRLQLDDELRAQPVGYLQTPTSSEIQLPIKAGEVGADDIEYSAWSESYVILAGFTVPRSAGGAWPRGQPRPAYLIGRGGAVKQIDTPYPSWNRGEVAAAALTRSGLLIVSDAIGRNDQVGSAGIYRVFERTLEPVFRGYVIGIAVSPTGCEVAAISRDRKTFAFSLNAINVCNGKR